MAREKHRPMAARVALSVPHFQFIPKKTSVPPSFPTATAVSGCGLDSEGCFW